VTVTDQEPKPVRSDGGVGVSLENLRRSYGNLNALDGLSLDIEPGEMVVLLGPSGCGKTTALRILAGLDRADEGVVRVGGEDITRVPANKRDMGMVFQAYSLFPHLTVRDNVAFGLRLRGQDRSRRLARAREVLDLVGLSRFEDRYAHQLSGGQQQRVALARALAVEPAVLLLDEPLSALDAKVRVQLREEIRRVQLDVGTTTLFVTHDQEEALAVADRVGVMNSGRLDQIAGPTELYARPATRFVAEFVGLSNRLRTEVSDGSADVLGTRLPLLDGSVERGEGHALVRPEAVQVEAVEAAQDANGRVVSVAFLGPFSRVQCRLSRGGDDGQIIVAQLPSADVQHLRQDQAVRIGVAAEAVLVVPD
jgi:putative spermidine/putrescine transport system ATP-binding protein